MARKGERLSRAMREKLSRLAIERHRRNISLRKGDPEFKRCNRCSKRKPLDEFYKFKRKLASGETAVYPQSSCKRCDIEIRTRNWQRLKDEGFDVAALKRRYEANEDQERRRQRWKENYAIWRSRHGGTGPTRNSKRLHAMKGLKLPIEPIALLLEREESERDRTLIAEQTGVGERRIYGIVKRETATVSLSVIDQLLTGLGLSHELPVLYPEG